jgi:hypothetical protein
MAEPNFIQDISSLLSAIQAARGTKNTTTRSNNVTPEQAQALMQDMLKSSGGLRDIIASHRSSGLRSSSGQQAAVENLMAKVAAEGAKASSKETVVQQGAGVTRGNEAKILAGLAAATPILKPIVSPLWDAASKKYQDWASSAFGSTDTGADLVGPSADQISAFDSFGTLGTSGADYAADAIDYSAPLYSEAFSTWGSLGSSMVEDAAVDWGGSAASDVGTSMFAARGGMVVDAGKMPRDVTPRTLRVTPTISNGYEPGIGHLGAPANPSYTAPNEGDGFGNPGYMTLTPTQVALMAAKAIAKVVQGNLIGAALGIGKDTVDGTEANYLAMMQGIGKAKRGAPNVGEPVQDAEVMNPDAVLAPVAIMQQEAQAEQAVQNDAQADSGDGGGNGSGGDGGGFGYFGAVGGFGPAAPGGDGDGGGGGTATAARGGRVSGDSKPGVDDSLVALDGGEYVIPADVVATLGVDKFDQLLSTFGYKPRRVKGVPI